MCLPSHSHGGHRTTLSVDPRLPPCLRQGLLLFVVAQARLADPHTSEASADSTSHLTLKALELKVHVTILSST